MTVAALYVDPAGVYANLPDVEVWDEARDARLYPGPWPVVAHPPCARWSLMTQCRPELRSSTGRDDGCFGAALAAVRRFGGVLEHPAHSRAWSYYDLPAPATGGWSGSMLDEGWATEVDQALYGAPYRKPTWLYCAGVEPRPLRWGKAEPQQTTVRWIGSGRSSATPLAFRDVLLAMARSATEVAACA